MSFGPHLAVSCPLPGIDIARRVIALMYFSYLTSRSLTCVFCYSCIHPCSPLIVRIIIKIPQCPNHAIIEGSWGGVGLLVCYSCERLMYLFIKEGI